MSITTKFQNKVLATAQVSRPHGEIQNNPLNSDLARNPSVANNNAAPPTVPASHARSGMQEAGTNGPGVPSLGHKLTQN
jgi:hypothetical protein